MTRPILELCLAAEQRLGARFLKEVVGTGGARLGGYAGGGERGRGGGGVWGGEQSQ